MNGWQVLDIEPTSDESLIRRAYARQLKLHRPDTDPQGYQQLREAFDWAKAHASATETDVSEPQYYGVAEHQNISSQQDELSFTESVSYSFSLRPLYSEQEIAELAATLADEGPRHFPALQTLHQQVSEEGNLLQQQKFHKDLAAALAQQPELAGWLVEAVSERLGWQLDSYNSDHLIPQVLQDAMCEKVRATEAENAWKKLIAEQHNDDSVSGLALKLLCSDRTAVPFWIRLVPGLFDNMSQQVNKLWVTFPELVQRLNPVMLAFLREQPCALSWKGVFLVLFWAAVLHFALPRVGLISPIGLIASCIAIYHLWVYDLMLSNVHRSWLMGLLLILDAVFSSLLLFAFFAGLLFIVIGESPGKGEGAGGLLPFFMMFIEWLVLWSVWSKQVPGLRRPGLAVARLLSSPWRLLDILEFEIIGYVLVSFYAVFCSVLLNQLLTLFARFSE